MELSASMMCAKFDNLREEIRLLNEAGIDSYHIDIMDGMFVPNLGMGLQDIECISRNTMKALEAHLMVRNIEPYLQILHKCRVNTAYIHPEADYHPFSTLQKMKTLGIEPGLAIDPGTSVESIRELLNVVKKVLIMAVNPGGAGHAYLPYIEEKVQQLIDLKVWFLPALGRSLHGGADTGICSYGGRRVCVGYRAFVRPQGVLSRTD